MSQAATAPTTVLPRDSVAAPGTVAGPRSAADRARARKRLRLLLMGGGVAAVAAASLVFWLNGGRWVSIDNAYVRADKQVLSTDVSGIVAEVPVHEGQAVHKGDVLFRLDDRQFRIALESAQSNLAQTALTIESMKRDYQRMLRDIATKSALVQADQARFDRAAALVNRGDTPRQTYDDARFQLAADQQGVESARASAEVQLAKLGGDPNVDPTTLPSYRQAQSQVAEAQRQLDHSVVHAPFDGIVTNVDTVQPGLYLMASIGAFGIVGSDHVWIDANPKETELTWVKPGDHVDVAVDTYPGRHWDGVVESISPASGSEFSILPAQNSSGNWVKVVQRIPLRVRVEAKPGDPVLRSGMSTIVDIDTGHVRHLSDLY